MATGGWGAMGGGAWGGGNGKAAAAPADFNDEDVEQGPAKPVAPTAAYGAHTAPVAAYGSATIGRGRVAEPATFETQAPYAASTNREAELRKKEQALALKEKELKEMEERLKAAGATVPPRKNWPICWPWLYHDIAAEIPEGNARRVVREGYAAWYGLILCMLWNFICASTMLGQDVKDKIASWFLAILYCVTGIPISFFVWYRRLYHGCKEDSTLGMVSFFLMFMLHIAFCIWATVAVPFTAERWSFAGFVAATEAFDVSSGIGAMYFIGASLWTLEALYSIWVLKDAFFFFRGRGGVQQAKKDVAVAAFAASMSRKNEEAAAEPTITNTNAWNQGGRI